MKSAISICFSAAILAGAGLASDANAATHRVDVEANVQALNITSGTILSVVRPEAEATIAAMLARESNCVRYVPLPGLPEEFGCFSESFDLLDYEAAGLFDRSGYVWQDTLTASIFIEAGPSEPRITGCSGDAPLCRLGGPGNPISFDGVNLSAQGGSNSSDAFTQLNTETGVFSHGGGYLNFFDRGQPQTVMIGVFSVVDFPTGSVDARYQITSVSVSTVPIAGAAPLLFSGLVFAGAIARRRRR